MIQKEIELNSETEKVQKLDEQLKLKENESKEKEESLRRKMKTLH